ncbi:beta-propeller fold lactonase family protein [Demequina sp. NBRC 110055]|uniref:lactonase family protein n=1 Tax=Demequina sp. NBRC 110055 TaxID=1570344 RepID=UPI001356525F|nr:beta-propeller fold lactonase family protein [Demequina sp. NBRC 110055]
MTNQLWWGTFPEAGLGTPTGMGEGLWRQTPADATLALALDAPSWLVAHPSLPLIYAISESEHSQVHAVDVSDPASPRVLASIPTGGSSACHGMLAAGALTLYLTHYVSSELSVIRIGDDGLFEDDAPAQMFAHAGSGPNEARQDASHAHFVGYAPGRKHLLVCDLGTDELRRYALRPDGLLDDDGIAAALPPGTGPRHFAVNGDLIYVLGELSTSVLTLRWEPATASADLIAQIPATTSAARTAEARDSSGILQVDDVLLVGVRGADVIAVHDLSPEGEVRYRGSFDAGHWPRHFAVVGDRLHVGCERGHEVRTYALADVLALAPEPEVGLIQELPSASAALPSPAFVMAG